MEEDADIKESGRQLLHRHSDSQVGRLIEDMKTIDVDRHEARNDPEKIFLSSDNAAGFEMAETFHDKMHNIQEGPNPYTSSPVKGEEDLVVHREAAGSRDLMSQTSKGSIQQLQICVKDDQPYEPSLRLDVPTPNKHC